MLLAPTRPSFPHCDSRILHAPGECRFCDQDPHAQTLRQAWGIAFTGHPAPDGGLPCPADHARGDGHKAWGGNRPAPSYSAQLDAEGYPVHQP